MKPVQAKAAPVPGSPRKKTIAAGPRDAAIAAGPRDDIIAEGPVVTTRKTPGRPRKTKAASPAKIDAIQAMIVGSLEDDKAENVVALDLTGRAMFCDRMVIASGLADRQIAAMAQHLKEKLHAAGQKRVQIEGLGGSDWVLIDAGDIVVHLFMPEARELYALEKMWGAALDEVAG